MIEYGEAFLEGKGECLSEYFGKSQRQGRISVESSNQTTEERSPFWVGSVIYARVRDARGLVFQFWIWEYTLQVVIDNDFPQSIR